MVYGCGGNDGVLLCRSGKHIRTAHWLASPHHSPLSHYHQHQPTTPILTCPSTTLLLVWIMSLACFMGNLPPSPLLTTRLRPALPLLVLRVVRLPDLLGLPAFLANQSTHFQEETMARGLAIKHLEVDPVPEVADTCLGFTAVAMAEVFSELEKHDEEVGIWIPSSLQSLLTLFLLEFGVEEQG